MTQLLPLSIILALVFLSSLNNGNQHPFVSSVLFIVGVVISLTIFDIVYNVSKNVCNYVDPNLLSSDPSRRFYSNFCEVIGSVFSMISALYLGSLSSDFLLSLN